MPKQTSETKLFQKRITQLGSKLLSVSNACDEAMKQLVVITDQAHNIYVFTTDDLVPLAFDSDQETPELVHTVPEKRTRRKKIYLSTVPDDPPAPDPDDPPAPDPDDSQEGND